MLRPEYKPSRSKPQQLRKQPQQSKAEMPSKKWVHQVERKYSPFETLEYRLAYLLQAPQPADGKRRRNPKSSDRKQAVDPVGTARWQSLPLLMSWTRPTGKPKSLPGQRVGRRPRFPHPVGRQERPGRPLRTCTGTWRHRKAGRMGSWEREDAGPEVPWLMTSAPRDVCSSSWRQTCGWGGRILPTCLRWSRAERSQTVDYLHKETTNLPVWISAGYPQLFKCNPKTFLFPKL